MTCMSSTVAIDLAKDVFELAFADAQGRVVERKRLSRKAFARGMEQRPPLRVLMEACGGAHYWGRRFQRQGCEVRLLPARDVRAYVRGNKTDRNDAAGLLEADRCGDIADVPLKMPEQQGVQALHRLREHLKGERTAPIKTWRAIARPAASVGLVGATAAGPQQGRVCAGQQAGAAAMGDGAPRQGLRPAACQPTSHDCLNSIFNHVRRCRKRSRSW